MFCNQEQCDQGMLRTGMPVRSALHQQMRSSFLWSQLHNELTDGFEILAGANIFLGDEGRFGQFADNNMVYTKIKFSF